MGDIEQVFEEIKEATKRALRQAIEDARDDVIKIVKDRTAKGKRHDGQNFSPYSDRHTYRRKKEGLQTNHKDMRFTSTLFDNFEEITRIETDEKIGIIIGFKGQSKRRKDQGSAGNADVAVWLSEQEGGSIIKLSSAEREAIVDKIQEKFNLNLQIND